MCVQRVQMHGVLVKVPTVMAALLEHHQSPMIDLCRSLGNPAVMHS